MNAFAPPLGAWVTPALPCTRWILVENPSAGTNCAPRAAWELADALQSDGQDAWIHTTHGNPAYRVHDIARLLHFFRPSLNHPIGVLALGGDGTTNDALRGILQYLFPRPFDLVDSADGAMDRMLDSGIQLGNVRMGGSSQIGQLHGAPLPDIEGMMEYLRSSEVTPLNLGVVMLDSGITYYFSHNASVGTLNAPVYEATRGERGRTARYHQKALGIWNLFRHRDPFRVRWSGGGSEGESDAREVLIHATPRARNTNGLPGTPAGGLGTKIIPDLNLADLMRFNDEIKRRGDRVTQGELEAIDPNGILESLPAALQAPIPIGEEREFIFTTTGRWRSGIPVQANGDALGRCRHLWVQALPPFPRFLVHPDSVMDSLRRSL